MVIQFPLFVPSKPLLHWTTRNTMSINNFREITLRLGNNSLTLHVLLAETIQQMVSYRVFSVLTTFIIITTFNLSDA